MICRIAVTTAVLLAASPAAAQPERYLPEWPVLLQTEMLKQARLFDGEAHVFVKDLQSGERYTYNSATPTYIASAVKVPFMVALFRLIADGRASLDEELRYEADDVRDGAPVFNYLKVGSTVPLRVVLEAMIHQSDNAASDMIVRRVGVENINRILAEEGFTGFGPLTSLLEVRRLVYRELHPRAAKLSAKEIRSIGFAGGFEQRALRVAELVGELPGTYTIPDLDRAYREYYRTGYNSASMDAVGHLLEQIATGKVISPEASQAMVEVMLGTLTGPRRMAGRLPPGTAVAHKTGTQYQRICDVGLIYVAADRPVVFAACTKGGSKKRAEDLISAVARKTYEVLAPDALAARWTGSSTVGVATDSRPVEKLRKRRTKRTPKP